MERIIYLLSVLILLGSCVNTKRYNEVRLKEGTKYYSLKYIPSPVGKSKIEYAVKSSEKGNHAQITIKNNIAYLKPTKGKPDSEVSPTRSIEQGAIHDTTFIKLKTIAGQKGVTNVFPSPIYELELKKGDLNAFTKEGITIPKLEEKGEFKTTDKLVYYEGQTVFQAMTVPIKYRSQLNDTIAAQTTSSFNVGFAFGKKFTRKTFTQIYRDDKLLNSVNTSLSITPGAFIGPTLISLENGKSVHEPIDLDRTVAGITGGVFLVAGVNKFNAGIAFGLDQALGKDSEKWIYQDNPFWWGFILSIDFIK